MWAAISVGVLLVAAISARVWADVRRRAREGADPETLSQGARARYYRDHED